MARNPEATDFYVEVEGVGVFSFAKRQLRDEMRIAAEYSRLTEGVETPTEFLAIMGGWLAALKVLTVSAPSDWDLDTMDPLDDGTYAKIAKVHNALREKENSFRGVKGETGKTSRPGNSQGAGVLVPQEVQPGAN